MVRATRPLLRVDRPAVPPGSRVGLTGEGCDPATAVSIEVDDRAVQSGRADTTGSFSLTLDVPDLDVGRHRVVARCGPAVETVLDIVLVTRVEGGTTSMAVLAFFILVGLAVIRRQRDPRPARR